MMISLILTYYLRVLEVSHLPPVQRPMKSIISKCHGFGPTFRISEQESASFPADDGRRASPET